MSARQETLSGWGRAPRSTATVVPVTPERQLYAEDAPRGVLPRGLGRSYGDAALNAGGIVYDMTADSGLVHLDAERGTATARAGTSLGDLMAELVPRGWFPPVVPGTRHVTVGGAIAADVHGKNHHVAGGFCQHVTEFTLDTPAGERLRITPEEEPDVFWATAGGMGLTGVVREATFRLIPLEAAAIRVDTERASDLDDLMAKMTSRDEQYRYSVAWVDLLTTRGHGRGVLSRGDHATRAEAQARPGGDIAYRPPRGLPLPDVVPSGALHPAVVKAFNEAWFRKAPKHEAGRLEGIASFFHPLDALASWNRVYGARGLVQYQFVLPSGRDDVLRAVVEQMAHERVPVYLAVLKRMGEQPGMLSFPMQGWTLAVDMPADPGLAGVLHRLDERIAEAGGRVYLAKDARMRTDVFRAMYPALDRWRAVRERLDPAGLLRSDQGRRLGLVG